jgi:hypothetical protein
VRRATLRGRPSGFKDRYATATRRPAAVPDPGASAAPAAGRYGQAGACPWYGAAHRTATHPPRPDNLQMLCRVGRHQNPPTDESVGPTNLHPLAWSAMLLSCCNRWPDLGVWMRRLVLSTHPAVAPNGLPAGWLIGVAAGIHSDDGPAGASAQQASPWRCGRRITASSRTDVPMHGLPTGAPVCVTVYLGYRWLTDAIAACCSVPYWTGCCAGSFRGLP